MPYEFTPERITQLQPAEVFVFGSNKSGIHLAGAARTAWLKFGAKFGKGTGHHGQTYAINTMSGLEILEAQIQDFLQYAAEHPDLVFLVTPIGCGIGKYDPQQIAPNFKQRSPNIIIPKQFS